MNALESILRPLSLEEKTGCKNLSVMGGLGSFLSDFLMKAHTDGELTGEEYEKAAIIAQSYDKSSTDERKCLISRLKHIISHNPDVSDNNPPKSKKPSSLGKKALEKPISKPQKTAEAYLDSAVQYAKGVGPSLGRLLSRLGIQTIGDLLSHYPRRYDDRSNIRKITELQEGEYCTVLARVISRREMKTRRNITITKALVTDSSGAPLSLSWFNQPFRAKTLSNGVTFYASGKAEFRGDMFEMNSPETESAEGSNSKPMILPVYALTEGLSQKTLRRVIKTNLEQYCGLFPEIIPEEIIHERKFKSRAQALKSIHCPESAKDAEEARKRLAYEELFLSQIKMLSFRAAREKLPKNRNYGISPGLIDEFRRGIPFTLTNAQNRALKEIMIDLTASYPMSRLIHGDVGSGKTIVAAGAVFAVTRSGFQAAVMAPTEILAEQHYKKFKVYLEPYGINTALLTGSTKKRDRECIIEGIRDGSIQVLIGTHALIQDGVEFKNLALAVIDEQHRFGVMQRTGLQKKGNCPDILVMTATPIPRTLSLTLYGDLKISAIDELPPGRKEIKSYFCPLSKSGQMWEYIRKEIKKGCQAYIVCPLIDESDKTEAAAAVKQAEDLKSGCFSDLKVSLLHGKMKPAEKEEIMEKFRLGETDVLIATTVIEVGVDVPNATVMVIMNSERFGLAQLHQLRGRIGRGEKESACFFTGDIKTEEARIRMETMIGSNDGFAIAERDLELRGPGDFFGTRQHGLPEFHAADIAGDKELMEVSRKDAASVIKKMPSYSALPEVRKAMKLIYSDPAEIIH